MTRDRERLDVEDVKARVNLVALIGERVELRRSGFQFTGLCPFHTEKTPSFVVHPDNGWYCLAGDTGVITDKGVLPIRLLSGKTARILTKGPRGPRWTRAPFEAFGKQQLWRITLSRNGKRKTVYATKEHRWFVGRPGRSAVELTTRDLKSGSRLITNFPLPVATRLKFPSPFGIARGFVFGDGTSGGKPGSEAQFCGDKDAAMRKWFPLPAWRARHKYKTFRILSGLPTYFKTKRPAINESASYLYGWLAGYFAADGSVSDDGGAGLASARREDLEHVERLCARLGIGTYEISEYAHRGFGGKVAPLYSIHFMTSTLTADFFLIDKHRARFLAHQKLYERLGWIVRKVEPTDRVETVYCAVVNSSHCFTIEGNILTGNCHGCGQGGDAISFVMRLDGLSFADALASLATFSGASPSPPPLRRAAPAAEPSARDAAALWSKLADGDDTGDAYLVARGLLYRDSDVLRFNVGRSGDQWLDARAREGYRVAFAVRRPSGDIQTVSLRYTTPGDPPSGKKTLVLPGCSTKCAAICLPSIAYLAFGDPEFETSRILVVEGGTSWLGAMALFEQATADSGSAPTWPLAVIGVSQAAGVVEAFTAIIQRRTVLVGLDADEPGVAASKDAMAAALAAGAKKPPLIAKPPRHVKDWADLAKMEYAHG